MPSTDWAADMLADWKSTGIDRTGIYPSQFISNDEASRQRMIEITKDMQRILQNQSERVKFPSVLVVVGLMLLIAVIRCCCKRPSQEPPDPAPTPAPASIPATAPASVPATAPASVPATAPVSTPVSAPAGYVVVPQHPPSYNAAPLPSAYTALR